MAYTGQKIPSNAMPVQMQNFTPWVSTQLAVSTSTNPTAPVPAANILGPVGSVFKITNTGDETAYVAWGHGSATAIVSTPGTWAEGCDAIAAGGIFTQTFINFDANTTIDTLAAITSTGSTTLEITYGYGQ